MSTDPQWRETKPTRSDYFSLLSALTDRYPNLIYLHYFIQRKKHSYPVRVTVLEFHRDKVVRKNFGDIDQLDAFEELQVYLESAPRDTLQYRLYLVEDLNPQYIDLLGSILNIDGAVFASQIRDQHFSGTEKRGHAPKLPSFHNPNKSFTLKYYEARYFVDETIHNFSSSLWTAANVRRQITFGIGVKNAAQRDPTLGHVGFIRRNTSFWSRQESNGGWNAILLLDPGMNDHLLFPHPDDPRGEPVRSVVKTQLFQGGYRDFTSWPSWSSCPSFPLSAQEQLGLRGPERISLLDDICHYWQHTASQEQRKDAIKDSFNSTQFQLHIIASIWMNSLEHIYGILSPLETMLWSIEHMISPNLSNKAKEGYMRNFTRALNENNTLRRRLNWYISEMETNMLALGFSPSSPSSHPSDHEKNFRVIYEKLLSYQSWSEKLLDIVTTQMNLTETQKSIADSNSLSRLTILGFVFVPVSFVCSFFSMGGDFAVGESKFWIYFAVTIPLTFAILILGFWNFWWRKLAQRKEDTGYYPWERMNRRRGEW